MKKYTYYDKGTRGSLPPALFECIDKEHIADATAQFSEYMTELAKQFHSQVNFFGTYSDLADIELDTPKLFGQDVVLKYIDSGTTGTVYKITIGSKSFAFKINRSTRIATDEIENMHIYSRARNLVNRVYIASPFINEDGEEFTWLLSDYIDQDIANSFETACQKLYFAYITKGIAFSDGHYNNFKNGKIIDTDSFRMRIGGQNDFEKLNKKDIDTIKKLVRFIKTNDKKSFQDLLKKTNPRVIDYLFFSMSYARSQFFGSRNKDNDFLNKVLLYEKLVQEIHQVQNAKKEFSMARQS